MNKVSFPLDVIKKIDGICSKFPSNKPQSAVMMSLRVLQDQAGYLTKESMNMLAVLLNVPVACVYEVAHFYSLFRHKPHGKLCVKVCQGLPCALRGSMQLLQAFEQEFGIQCSQTTEDGMLTLMTTGCQAACTQAPVVLMNDCDVETISNAEALSAWRKKWLCVQDKEDGAA